MRAPVLSPGGSHAHIRELLNLGLLTAGPEPHNLKQGETNPEGRWAFSQPSLRSLTSPRLLGGEGSAGAWASWKSPEVEGAPLPQSLQSSWSPGLPGSSWAWVVLTGQSV